MNCEEQYYPVAIFHRIRAQIDDGKHGLSESESSSDSDEDLLTLKRCHAH